MPARQGLNLQRSEGLFPSMGHVTARVQLLLPQEECITNAGDFLCQTVCTPTVLVPEKFGGWGGRPAIDHVSEKDVFNA